MRRYNMKDNSILIKGVGYYLPEKRLTNDDLSKIVDTSDEWIRTRTGISERHIASNDEATSDLAYQAALNALENAQCEPESIDALIVATVTPDMLFPSTAALVQAKLGLRNVLSFDINAACSGFLYALEVGRNLLNCPHYKRILVVGSEKISSIVNWEDRGTCVLFGDGAGAFILERSEEPNVGILDQTLGADGAHAEVLCLPAGGSRLPASIDTVQRHLHTISMNGKELFKMAVRLMAKSVEDLLERNNLTHADIAWLVPHQANLRIIQSLAQTLEVPMERIFCNLDKTGNTSAASIPIAFAQADEQKYFKKGDYIVLVAFGGGLTWGASLIKYA